jgi:membrane protein DedA with SNARE-associated domain
MTEKLLAIIFLFINSVISATGYVGIALLMAIESACIPLPSELIMPFAGYLYLHRHVQATVGGDGRGNWLQPGVAGGV